MDDILKRLYKPKVQLKQASYTATGLAGIIALLGALGLVSLSIEKRRKEIGIRKILGSSVMNVTVLFVREFLIHPYWNCDCLPLGIYHNSKVGECKIQPALLNLCPYRRNLINPHCRKIAEAAGDQCRHELLVLYRPQDRNPL